jgi:DNA-binding NarL/FixJ family response regulator
MSLPPGAELPGRVWQTAEPSIEEIGESSSPAPRWQQGTSEGLRGAVALPAVDGDDVLAVVELVFTSDVVITERLMRSLSGIGHELGHFLRRRRGELEAMRLTARELEVLQLVARGNSMPQIAQVLVVSPSTVKSHLENIYAKLQVSDRASAVATALRLGLID